MGSEWDSPNLRPVGYALAAAIVICAIPLAYRITNCASFDSGFSLEKLFSFKCDAKSEGQPHTPDVSRTALAAQTLTVPRGYVAYRVENGIARASGSLRPADGRLAPAFAEVKEGLVLVATQQKQLRERPFSASPSHLYPEGQCFEVIRGDSIQDELPEDGRSGGWLPVELATCPAAAILPAPIASPTRAPANPTSSASAPLQALPVDKAPASVAATSLFGLPPLGSRAQWDVGLTTCAIEENQAEEIQRFLENDLAFSSARPIIKLPSRANWIPQRNKVFFYRDASRPAAEGLASELTRKFGFRFEVGKGAGLGLQPGYESRTLFVHVMSSAC